MQGQRVIAARLARFAASRDARDVWPEVSAAAFRAAHVEIARVTAAVLGGGRRPVQLTVPRGTDSGVVGIAAFTGGMGPLLGHWCETGTVAAEAGVARVLATHLDHARGRLTSTQDLLERLLERYAAAGIPVMLLRGTHTRYRYFPEPATRSASDIHVLVQPADWPRARAVLEDLGLTERGGHHPDRSLWTLGGAYPVHSLEFAHRSEPPLVELRRSLRLVPLAGLTAFLESPPPSAAEVWPELSRAVRCFPPPLLLAYLALHASRHFYAMMLVRLAELVLIAQQSFAGRPAAWRAFDELLDRASLRPFVFPALDLAERLVPGTLPAEVYGRLTGAVPASLLRRVQAYTPGSILEMHPLPPEGRSVWDPREQCDLNQQA